MVTGRVVRSPLTRKVYCPSTVVPLRSQVALGGGLPLAEQVRLTEPAVVAVSETETVGGTGEAWEMKTSKILAISYC